MKAFVTGVCLVVWMLLTIVLTASIVGMLLFVPIDTYQNAPNVPSTWMTVGKTLLNSLAN
jgi:hypothetical protein